MAIAPNAATVLRARARLRFVIRLIAVILGLAYLTTTIPILLDYLMYSHSRLRWDRDTSVVSILFLSLKFGMFIAAILLLAIDRWLLRWIVPMPIPGCPFCGYASLPTQGDKCIECGNTLPSEILADRTP